MTGVQTCALPISISAKFAHFLIRTTAEMDKIIQTRAIVNLNVTTGTVTAQGTTIKDYDL